MPILLNHPNLEMPILPQTFSHHEAAWLQGKLYVIGGQNNSIHGVGDSVA